MREGSDKTSEKRKIKNPKFTAFSAAAAAGFLALAGTVIIGVRPGHYGALSGEGEYMVLVYMVGSDLEGDYSAAGEDLKEMQEVLAEADISPEQVRIVVEAGGATEWHCEPMQDTAYARFYITSEGIGGIEEMEVRNMGEADTLTDFINYGTQVYPAKNYGLVFWNHGAGPVDGFGCDLNFDDDSLTLPEIKAALEQSGREQPFEFISFDACLMASVELAGALQGQTRYLIASEDLEPVEGHNYDWMKVFGQTRTDGETIGKAILAAYAEAEQGENQVTLSLMDMENYEPFQTALNAFLKDLLQREGENSLFEETGVRRLSLQGFGSRTDGTAELVDMMGLLQMWKEYGDPQLYEAAEAAFDEFLIEQVAKGYAAEPGGLSIYLPSGADWDLESSIRLYEENEFSTEYRSFVSRYGSFLAEENNLSWDTPKTEEDVLQVMVDPEDIASIANAYLVAFKEDRESGDLYLYYSDSDCTVDRSGFVEAIPEEAVIGLCGQPLCLVEIMDTEEYAQYMAPVLYNGECCNLFLGFADDTGEVEAVIPENTKKQEYQLENGDRIIPLYPLEETEENSPGDSERIYEDLYYMGEEIIIEDIAAGDALPELVEIDREELFYGFLIRDNRQKLFYTELVRLEPEP